MENKEPTKLSKFEELMLEAAKARIIRGQLKYQATHQLIGRFQPQNGFYALDDAGNRVKIKVGAKTKDGKPVLLNRTRFTGWDYGKKYTGKVLRELAEKRKSA